MCEDFRRWFTCGCLLKSHSLASPSSEKSGWSQVGLRASFSVTAALCCAISVTQKGSTDRASQTKDVKKIGAKWGLDEGTCSCWRSGCPVLRLCWKSELFKMERPTGCCHRQVWPAGRRAQPGSPGRLCVTGALLPVLHAVAALAQQVSWIPPSFFFSSMLKCLGILHLFVTKTWQFSCTAVGTCRGKEESKDLDEFIL